MIHILEKMTHNLFNFESRMRLLHPVTLGSFSKNRVREKKGYDDSKRPPTASRLQVRELCILTAVFSLLAT